MLYVDSPAGVGLSFSETKEDYVTNDTHTAADLNTFLRAFFSRYAAFSKQDFYISGSVDIFPLKICRFYSATLCIPFFSPCTSGTFRAFAPLFWISVLRGTCLRLVNVVTVCIASEERYVIYT